MSTKRITTVTYDNWGVSVHSHASEHILHVYRMYEFRDRIGTMEHTKFAYGEAFGKAFKSSEEAFNYAFEHGYTKQYFPRAVRNGRYQ
jgi:hypothetical protein